MKLQTGVLSTLAECDLGDVTQTSIWRHSGYGNISMMSLVKEYGRQHMPCSAQFSMTLQI